MLACPVVRPLVPQLLLLLLLLLNLVWVATARLQ